jgi:hypothetical protein
MIHVLPQDSKRRQVIYLSCCSFWKHENMKECLDLETMKMKKVNIQDVIVHQLKYLEIQGNCTYEATRRHRQLMSTEVILEQRFRPTWLVK